MRTNADLARFHGVDERTVRRWRTAGAPLCDDEAMYFWKAANGRTSRHSMDRGELRVSEPELSKAELDEWWLTVAKPIWEAHKRERLALTPSPIESTG